MSERGFVAEFYCQLKKYIEKQDIFPPNTILEAEVQKNLTEHFEMRQRPDLIIHIPVETSLNQKTNENNFIVYAFKLRGNLNSVREDFDKLDEMFGSLNYRTGVLINIGAYPNIFLTHYTGIFAENIHEISIALENGHIFIRHASFEKGQPIIQIIE